MTATRTKAQLTNQRKRDDIARWRFHLTTTYQDPGTKHPHTRYDLAETYADAIDFGMLLCCWHHDAAVVIKELGQ